MKDLGQRPLPLWRRNPTRRFRERARDYAPHRPDYPPAALDEILRGLGPPTRIRAADVGAGTGIASRLLAERGVTVCSVEPNRAMRSAAAAHPRIRRIAGTGERTGLSRASVDLVLCAQAFHWFDPQLALREFRRILKPRGKLAIVWNERSESDAFTESYTALVRASAGTDVTEATEVGLRAQLRRARFPRCRRLTFSHTQSLTLAGLLGQARSFSYAPRRGPAGAALRKGLRALHARFAEGSGSVRLVYRTLLYVATRGARHGRAPRVARSGPSQSWPRKAVSGLIAALVTAGAWATAEEPRVTFSGLLQVWYTQATEDSLRRNEPLVPPNRYYNLRPEFLENDFDVRRAEVKLTVKPIPEVEAEIMVDPSLGTATIGNILQDAALTLRPVSRLELKAGQFKTIQTYEGLLNSGALVFAERGQITRVFGDVRDRGAVLSWRFGQEPDLTGRLSAGVFNGGGRTSDLNGSKDVVGRLEMRHGPHRFGAYGLRGDTELPDRRVPLDFAGEAPAPAAVLSNRDRTWHAGIFYALEGARWFASAEALTGKLGRRFGSLGLVPGPAFREHLDQRIAGLVLTAAHTRGRHTLAARYDVADYNPGDRWYTDFDPYRESAPGVSRGADYTPRFTEVTVGYTFSFRADRPRLANVKLNYVARSKNFLRPAAGETGAQGFGSLIVALQASF